MSETFFITTNSPSIQVKDGSVGKILPGISIKITDRNNKVVSRGNEGEIIVKTPFLMLGYYNSDKNGPDLINEDTWFETGDIGFLSEDDELFITGRKKDLIIRGGVNISPSSIENTIYKHSAVIECAVVGIPHRFRGEEICVVVRLSEPSRFEHIKKEIIELCRKDLSSIKQPDRIIQVQEFPHSTYGKIQKRKIRAWLLKQPTTPKTYLAQPIYRKKTDFLPSKITSESIEALSIKYNTMVYEKQRKGEDIIVLSLGNLF